MSQGALSELPGGQGVAVPLLGMRTEPVAATLRALVGWIRETVLVKNQIGVSS